MEISPQVPERKIFEGFLPYMGMAAILVMWPPLCQEISFPSIWKLTYNKYLALIGQVVSEKSQF